MTLRTPIISTSRFVITLLLMATCLAFTMAGAEEEYVASVDIKKTSIIGIRLNHKENDIIRILGKPAKTIDHGNDEVIGGKSKTIYYQGLEIFLIDGEIYRLECKGSTCITDKGIRIGDTRKSVEKMYGVPSKYSQTDEQISYTFKLNDTYIDSSLIFMLKKNKVTRIIYFVDYV